MKTTLMRWGRQEISKIIKSQVALTKWINKDGLVALTKSIAKDGGLGKCPKNTNERPAHKLTCLALSYQIDGT